MNPFRVPEITPQTVAQRLANQDVFYLIDVREPYELHYATLGPLAQNIPLSDLGQKGLEALPTAIQNDKSADLVIFCHHGGRSAQVVAWLQQNGWLNSKSMEGGLHAYATLLDPSIGTY